MNQQPNNTNSIDLANQAVPGEFGGESNAQDIHTAQPELDMSDVDPTQAFKQELKNSYDATDDIYSTNNTHLLHGSVSMQAPPPQAQGGTQQEEQPSEPQGAPGVLESIHNFINSPENPLSTEGEIDTAKGIVGGADEGLFIAPANLLDYAFTEANLGIAGTLTGKSREGLLQENSGLSHFLYHAEHRELPDWLKTHTIHGQIINTVSQFAAGFTGVGALGKLSMAQKLATGLGEAAEAAPIVGKLLQYGGQALEDAPALQKVAQTAMETMGNAGKVFSTDTLSFDAQEGNLANLVADLAGNNVPLVSDVAKFLDTHTGIRGLAVNKHDTELEGRIKNGLTGQLGEFAGVAAFGAVKMLKQVRNAQDFLKQSKGLIQKGSKDFQTLMGHLKEVDNTAEAFKADFAKISKEDPAQLLDMLKDPAGVPESKVEVITPDDTMKEATDKVFKSYESIQQHRMGNTAKALEKMIKEEGKQGAKAFDKKTFGEAIAEKIRNGEHVDIQQEILNHTHTADLTNIDAYVANFKNILEATTTNVKRYESNADLLTRVKEVLGHDLGHEAWSKGLDGTKVANNLDSAFKSLTERGVKSLTQDEEALLEMMGLKLLSKHLIPSQMGILGVARFEAKAAGNQALRASLDAELNKLARSQKEAEALFDKYLSNAGRRLQAGGQAETALEAGTAFMQKFEDAKKGLPLLAKDGHTMTEAELDALSSAARDFHGMGDNANPGRLGLIGKHMYLWMKAMDTAANKVPSYTVGAVREIFYNNVLSYGETWKTIFYANHMMKVDELLSKGVGAGLHGDREAMLRVADEAEGFIRYMKEGLGGGLTVLRTGGKHALDYTPANPRVISAEGIRTHFGKSIGDNINMNLFGKIPMGKMADKVTDWIGHVVSIPTTHIIGGIDTSFKVANQRGLLWTELKQLGRFKGMDEISAREFAANNIDKVTEDLIVARQHGFKDSAPLSQNEVNLNQLQNLHNKTVFSTDRNALQLPLNNSDWSDRWVFDTFDKLDQFTRKWGIFGTYEMPFIKTYANALQDGIDRSPLVSWLSPYNRRILSGEMGTAAQQELQGRLVLGTMLMGVGIGAANNGLIAPVAGTLGVKRMEKQLTGEDTYTLKFPCGRNGAITMNLSKGSPITDGVFLPARVFQGLQAYSQGNLDDSAAYLATITTVAEAFNSKAFLRGLSVSLDSFLNPSYTTKDNFTRNVVTGGLGTLLMPGGRMVQNITRFTDPYNRDYEGLKSYVAGKLPEPARGWFLGDNRVVSPNYDMFGNPRPNDDYIDVTKVDAINATRLMTPIGIRYVQDDPLSKEIARFGVNGQTLTPPVKNSMIDGTPIPLDQYKNDKGESLWDAYNRELSNYRMKAFDGSGKDLTVREYLNALITSDDYQKVMQDNSVSHVPGRRTVVLGSRWAEIVSAYQEAKEAAKEIISGDAKYSTQYKNFHGDNLETVLDHMEAVKEGQAQ